MVRFILLALGCCLLLHCPLRAGSEQQLVLPPLEGRPESYSDLVGIYRITASAEPTDVVIDRPILLKVEIHDETPMAFPLPSIMAVDLLAPVRMGIELLPSALYKPRRDRLKILKDEARADFIIEPLPEKDYVDRTTGTWVFYFNLRPRDTSVEQIPVLQLVYYHPVFRRYQSSYTRAIPITVKPLPRVIDAPRSAYSYVQGPQVLTTAAESQWPTMIQWIIGLAAPPIFCLLLYGWWRYAYPDAATLARRMRKRATRIAVHSLKKLPPHDVESCAKLMRRYLIERFSLPRKELTPLELTDYLRGARLRHTVVDEVSSFFARCERLRFGPTNGQVDRSLPDEAIHLIQVLESE